MWRRLRHFRRVVPHCDCDIGQVLIFQARREREPAGVTTGAPFCIEQLFTAITRCNSKAGGGNGLARHTSDVDQNICQLLARESLPCDPASIERRFHIVGVVPHLGCQEDRVTRRVPFPQRTRAGGPRFLAPMTTPATPFRKEALAASCIAGCAEESD